MFRKQQSKNYQDVFDDLHHHDEVDVMDVRLVKFIINEKNWWYRTNHQSQVNVHLFQVREDFQVTHKHIINECLSSSSTCDALS